MSENLDEKKNKFSFSRLMENNKFVFGISVIIAFFVWVLVAMYASPEESYTLYGVPITIDTKNTIVEQKGYESFWQSDDVVDVTVTGPRYMITKLTNEDVVLSASLNTVDDVGVSNLQLKAALKHYGDEVKISQLSRTSVQVYFDVKKTKEFEVKIDDSTYKEHVAKGCSFSFAELPVKTVKLTGPESEMNKILSVTATPMFDSTLLSVSTSMPAELNLEGATTADTVSINKYITSIQEQKFFVKINIEKEAKLKPEMSFLGQKLGNVTVTSDPESLNVLIDTGSGFTGNGLTCFSVSYTALIEGTNTFTVKISEDTLPSGVRIVDDVNTVTFTVEYTPSSANAVS